MTIAGVIETQWSRGPLLFRVSRSSIHGYGLFACTLLNAGTFLGRISGPIVYSSTSRRACMSHEPKHDREIVLECDDMWCVVDARGSAFEWLNCPESDSNVYMTPEGELYTKCDVQAESELTCEYRMV